MIRWACAANREIQLACCADRSADLVGFSDGSLSGDGNNGGYSWVIALVKDGTIQKGDVLAGGGGASLAFDNTNLLLSSARMEDGGPGIGCRHCVCTRMD